MISLPIDAVVPALRQALSVRHQAVLEAPPGAGKTIRMPLVLLDKPWLVGQHILMLKPRRLAAWAAAKWLVVELGERVGEIVGYRIRLESRVDPKTRTEVVTEGILARHLQDDPAPDGVDLVIFDEFHERSLDADPALALTLNGRELLRDESSLKVLVISATLEGERFATLLGKAPVIRSEGRMFLVGIRWGRAAQPGKFIEPRAQQVVLQALVEESGSVLVFLPGRAEIHRVHEGLREALDSRPGVLLCPLHGELDLAAQRAAIEPASRDTRRVVLATDIIETSLTIDDVWMVINAGLARVPRFDPGNNMTRLETQRTSHISATQCTGHAGRLEPSVCYRLWSGSQHKQLPAYSTTEIPQADLAGLALQLARWGVAPGELTWLDALPTAAYAQARELLGWLGALNTSGTLGAHDQAMAELPTRSRIVHLLLCDQALSLGELACGVAALLGERDVQRDGGADLHSRLALLADETRPDASRGVVQRIRQLARQLRDYLRGVASEAVVDPGYPRWLGCLLAFTYPDRIARQRRAGDGDYRLANGRAAQFGEPNSLVEQPWLAIVDLGSHQGQREKRIYPAAELGPRLFDTVLAEQVSQRDELQWGERKGVLRVERQHRVDELVLSNEALPGLDEAARSQVLLGLVRRKGLELLLWTSELRQWQTRIGLLRRSDLEDKGESEWPDINDAALLERLEEWLPAYLGKVTRLTHFADLDLASILTGLLPWPLPQRFDERTPKALEVPSGSRIRLDYSETPSVLAVRLQELFDLGDTPRVAQGRPATKLHLLSPTHHSVQMTQDLASFWHNIYAEVEEDLKGHCPKHYWSDDPLVAEATARAKPRK